MLWHKPTYSQAIKDFHLWKSLFIYLFFNPPSCELTQPRIVYILNEPSVVSFSVVNVNVATEEWMEVGSGPRRPPDTAQGLKLALPVSHYSNTSSITTDQQSSHLIGYGGAPTRSGHSLTGSCDVVMMSYERRDRRGEDMKRKYDRHRSWLSYHTI